MSALRIVRQSDLSSRDRIALFERGHSFDHLRADVCGIMETVRTEGDAALRRYTEHFDGAQLDSLRVSPEEFAEAQRSISRARGPCFASSRGADLPPGTAT